MVQIESLRQQGYSQYLAEQEAANQLALQQAAQEQANREYADQLALQQAQLKLQQEQAAHDQKIADADKWTEADLASITYSGAMNWSRSDTKTSFESLMGDASNAKTKWFYAEDDELAMGILEALDGGGIDENAKSAFLSGQPVITGCGGLDEFYAVLRGETFADIASQCGGLMSVTYSPSMIQTAIQDMVDHLDGKEVEQDHVIQCENVTAENVVEYPSF